VTEEGVTGVDGGDEEDNNRLQESESLISGEAESAALSSSTTPALGEVVVASS
jgi:hypothetical protein